MAPRFQTVRQLIFWQYAKLICSSAMGNRTDFAFITYTYKRLLAEEITPSSLVTENKILVRQENACVYCGSEKDLQWEHLIPRSIGGPDNIDNLVLSCRLCNLRKGSKDPFQWYGRKRIKDLPRVVLGKYLKLVLDAHERNGTLDSPGLSEDSMPTHETLSDVFRVLEVGQPSGAVDAPRRRIGQEKN